MGRRLWSAYGAAAVRLRWLVVAAWVAGLVAVLTLLPPYQDRSNPLAGFAVGTPAVQAELRSYDLFGFPLVSRLQIVQRDPHGLSPLAQADAVLRAAALDQHAYATPLLGALPVPNTLGLFPGSTERGTTVITYLYANPTSGFQQQYEQARQFARQHLGPGDAYVGISGSVPARVRQGELIEKRLHLVEVVTILAIALVVGLTFRSLLAPVVTLAAAGLAVVLTLTTAPRLAGLLGVSIASDLRPLIVALLLGVVTDYSILFMAGLRERIVAGDDRPTAARAAARDVGPIVAVAGVTVAAGTASLMVARSALFSGFGPGMALTVVVGLVVSLTLVPALLALLGGWVFWPSHPAAPGGRHARDRSSLLARLVTSRRRAAGVAALAVGLLALGLTPLTHLGLSVAFTQSLPAGDPVARAAAAAHQGFAPGITAPTELLLEAPGIGSRGPALRRLETLLRQQPGLAGVLGPQDLPLPRNLPVLVTKDGNAARYLLVFDSPPLAARAIGQLRTLQGRLPSLLRQAGLPGARIGVAGDTALSSSVVADTTRDLQRTALAALAVNLVLLALFLRAAVAPLYLLACSVLGLSASLGATVFVFQNLMGHSGLTFYVPFAVAVLLLSLGSDYNIFAVGHVWQLADRRSLRDAVATSLPQTTRAITSAGAALATSFGLLALVPLVPFAELAFAMAVGILLDVLVVRLLLVPSLLTLVGPVSGWPSRRLRRGPDAPSGSGSPSPAGARCPAGASAGSPAGAPASSPADSPASSPASSPAG